MKAVETKEASLNISNEKLFKIIGSLTGGYPNPDEGEPIGPWGPIIREAIEKVLARGPQPQPWRAVFSPQPDPWRSANGVAESITYREGSDPARVIELNPQPLPPRSAFARALAQTVINRAELMQDIADGISGEDNGIIIIGGYLSRFADDICGNGHVFKIPHPHPHFVSGEPDAADLLVVASEFQRAAGETFNAALGKAFAGIAQTIGNAGVSRLNPA